VVDTYNVGDELEGKVTKVVAFGAFVEILEGVEGLVHISELAQHHVENPREIVSQGHVVNVKIIEVDADRRRLSLSLKRVDDADEVQPRADGQPLETPAPPQIDLSDEVFAEGSAVEERSGEEATEEALAEQPVAEEAAPPEPAAESTPEVPAGEPEVEPEKTDQSIEADAVDPEHQGPGDSEGHAPYAPDEAEPKSE
jgi:small subunit ribosomal protein S1